uniref:Uncharacterized protein n=1 Tax=Oryctolagus cuniculus TaxID=9986 RepID=A0A5F9DV73_RABIT
HLGSLSPTALLASSAQNRWVPRTRGSGLQSLGMKTASSRVGDGGSGEHLDALEMKNGMLVFPRETRGQPPAAVQGVSDYVACNVLDLPQGIQPSSDWPTARKCTAVGRGKGRGYNTLLQLHQNGDLVQESRKPSRMKRPRLKGRAQVTCGTHC